MHIVLLATLVVYVFSLDAKEEDESTKKIPGVFVTMLHHTYGDTYVDGFEIGVRVLGQSLRESNTKYEYVVLCTSDIPERVKLILQDDGWIVKPLEKVYFSEDTNERVYKLNVWRLTEYRRIVFIDADAIVLQNVDELFKCGSFCATFHRSDFFDSGVMVLQPSVNKLNQIQISMSNLRTTWSQKSSGDLVILNHYFERLKLATMFNMSVHNNQEDQMRLPSGYNVDVSFYYISNGWSVSQNDMKILHYNLGIAKPMLWWSYPLFDLNWKWDRVRARLPSKFSEPPLFAFEHWVPAIVLILISVLFHLCPETYKYVYRCQVVTKLNVLLISGKSGCGIVLFQIFIQTLSHLFALYSIPSTMRPKPAWFLFAIWTMFYLMLFYSLCCHSQYRDKETFRTKFKSSKAKRAETLIHCLLFLLTFFLLFSIPYIISSFYCRVFCFILFIVILYTQGCISGQRLLKIWYRHNINSDSVLPRYQLESPTSTEKEKLEKEIQALQIALEERELQQENAIIKIINEKEREYRIEIKKTKILHQKDKRNMKSIISENENVINHMRNKIRELLKSTVNSLKGLSKVRQNTLNKELLKAASTGEKQEVIRLIGIGADIEYNTFDKDWMTPLHYASQGGCSEVVEELLCCGATPTVGDRLKKTPLHISCEHGHFEVVLSLLSYGAVINSQNTDRKTPLHLAAAGGHTDVVQALLDRGTSCNIPDRLHKVPLHYASDRGHPEVVKALLYHGAKVNAKDRTKSAAIHLACAGGHTEVIQALLEHNSEFDTENDWHSPLNWALLGGHTESAKSLISNGARIFGKDEWDYSPVMIAMAMNNEEVIGHVLLSGKMSEHEVQMARRKYQLPPNWKASRDMHKLKYTNLKSGKETEVRHQKS